MKELDRPATASGGVASSSAETAGQALSYWGRLELVTHAVNSHLWYRLGS